MYWDNSHDPCSGLHALPPVTATRSLSPFIPLQFLAAARGRSLASEPLCWLFPPLGHSSHSQIRCLQAASLPSGPGFSPICLPSPIPLKIALLFLLAPLSPFLPYLFSLNSLPLSCFLMFVFPNWNMSSTQAGNLSVLLTDAAYPEFSMVPGT